MCPIVCATGFCHLRGLVGLRVGNRPVICTLLKVAALSATFPALDGCSCRVSGGARLVVAFPRLQLPISFARSARQAASHLQSIGGPVVRIISNCGGRQSTIRSLGTRSHTRQRHNVQQDCSLHNMGGPFTSIGRASEIGHT